MLGKCCAYLGWTPGTFWDAQLFEINAALDTYFEEQKRRKMDDAQLAAWIANATRAAYHAKNFKAFKPKDFYDPDRKPPTKEEVLAEKRAVREIFPDKLDRS